MADEKPGRTKRGTFAPGTSGNPGGIKKDAADKPRVKPFRTDGWVNFFTGHGIYGQDKRQGASFYRTQLTFDQQMEIWLGDDLAARAVETLPKEGLREGYDIVIPQGEDGDDVDESDLISQVTDKLNELKADLAIRKGLCFERGLGGGAVLIGANDGQSDLTKPLNLDRVRSIDYLTALEPRQIMPVYGYTDPQQPNYGEPEIYRITSRTYLPPKNGVVGVQTMDIHESRLLVFPGIRLSQFQNTTTQGGWGDSVLLRMWRVLRDFNLAWGSAGVLVSEFATSVYKMKDLWETLGSADGPAAFADRLQSMNLSKSTINATVIDAEDDYKREQTPIAGLPDMMDKFATRLAAAAEMPLTLLFGTSPGGLNATGESDIRFFYDKVGSFQKEKIEPHLRKLIQIIFRAMGKEEPEKWSIQFRPLWQESALDRAQAMLTSAQADQIWIGNGVYSAEEAADSHWGSGEWNPEIKIDFDARDRQEQAASAPVNQADLDILNPDSPKYAPSKLDPAHPDYIAPPPDPNLVAKLAAGGGKGGGKPPFGGKAGGGGGKAAPPARGKKVARKDIWHEDYDADQPRAEDGKWTSAGGTEAHFTSRRNEQGEKRTRVRIEHPATGASAHKEFKTKTAAVRFAQRFAGAEDRKAQMQGFRAPAAHELLEAAAKSEAAGRGAGFTYSPAQGKFKTEGYSVSIHPEFETKLHGKAIDEKTVEGYVAPKEEFFRSHPDAHIGGWYNPDDDHWYLDVSHVTNSKLAAVALGAQHHQKGIYDLKEGRTITENEYGEVAAGDRGDSAQSRIRSAANDVQGDRGRHAAYPAGGAPQARPAGRLDYSENQARDERGRWSAEGGISGMPSGTGSEASRPAPASDWRGAAQGHKDTEEAYKKDGKWDASRLDEHLAYVHSVIDGVQDAHHPQTVYMTGGGPASGKTSALLNNPAAGFPDKTHAAYINPDDAKEFLPEMKAGKAAGELGAAPFVHNESLHMSRLAMARAIAQGKDVVYDSTGDGTLKALTEKVNGLRARGVKRVVAEYATIDPDEAIRRSDKRSSEQGRYVPHDVVRGIHTLVSRTAVAAIKNGLFDEAKVWDNSGKEPKLVASYDKTGGLKIHDQANWDAFVKRGDAPLPPGWE